MFNSSLFEFRSFGCPSKGKQCKLHFPAWSITSARPEWGELKRNNKALADVTCTPHPPAPSTTHHQPPHPAHTSPTLLSAAAYIQSQASRMTLPRLNTENKAVKFIPRRVDVQSLTSGWFFYPLHYFSFPERGGRPPSVPTSHRHLPTTPVDEFADWILRSKEKLPRYNIPSSLVGALALNHASDECLLFVFLMAESGIQPGEERKYFTWKINNNININYRFKTFKFRHQSLLLWI